MSAKRVVFSLLVAWALLLSLAACTAATPSKPAEPPKESSQSQGATKADQASSKTAEKQEAAKPTPATKESAAKQAPAAKDLKTIRIGMLGSASDAGIIIALEKNYFGQQGLRLDITPFDTAAKMVAPLGTGDLEVGGGALGAALFNAVARDVTVKVVADKGSFLPKHGFSVLMLRKDLYDSGAVKTLQDLKGRKVAVSALGASPHYSLIKAYEAVGGKAEDIDLTTLAHPDMIVAMRQKAIDAGIETEPNAVLMEHDGLAIRWKPGDELVPNSQNAVVLYSGAWAAKDRDAANAFMVAYLKGVRDYNDAFEKNKGKAEVVAALIKYTTLKDAAVYDEMITPGLNVNGRANRQDIVQQQQWYMDKGLVKTPAPIDQLVDDSFADFAVKQLGEYK